MWDGELYKHGLEWDEVASKIKNVKKNSDEMEYHVYDIICDQTQHERLMRIGSLEGTKYVRIVKTYQILNI